MAVVGVANGLAPMVLTLADTSRVAETLHVGAQVQFGVGPGSRGISLAGRARACRRVPFARHETVRRDGPRSDRIAQCRRQVARRIAMSGWSSSQKKHLITTMTM